MALDALPIADHLVIITIHSWNEGARDGKGKSKERFDVLVGRAAAFRILIVRGARFFLRPIEFGHGLTQWAALEKCNIR